MNKKLTVLKTDENNVYLEIEDTTECCFELWKTEFGDKSVVKVKIPIKTWKKILKSWNNKKTN